MRRLRYPVLLVLGLGGCSAEPSFDERYAETQEEIGEKASAIDAELEDKGDDGVPPGATKREPADPR